MDIYTMYQRYIGLSGYEIDLRMME